MSDDQNIFKQKPLLFSQYIMKADFINNIWTTSNLDHPSNNTIWKLSSSHSPTSDIFQLAQIYTVFLYTFRSMGIFIMQNAFMHKAIPWQILCSVTQ